MDSDPTITPHDGPLALAGLSCPEATARQAAKQRSGAGWISFEAQYFPPHSPDMECGREMKWDRFDLRAGHGYFGCGKREIRA
jgi:hypothetical protein